MTASKMSQQIKRHVTTLQSDYVARTSAMASAGDDIVFGGSNNGPRDVLLCVKVVQSHRDYKVTIATCLQLQWIFF